MASGCRGKGLGKRLIEEIDGYARKENCRCLWLETSSFNYPAVKFYESVGFRLCGLDTTLYSPKDAPGETALYMARTIE